MTRKATVIDNTLGTYATEALFITPVKYGLELAHLGAFGRNQYMGGSVVMGIDCSSAGDKDLQPLSLAFLLDNVNSQLTNSTNIIVRARYYLRVSNAAVTLTPKILKSTDDITYAAATISGQAACSATNSDFSGTNQKQTIALTLDAALKYYKPQVTVSGTPAAGYEGWAYVLFDIFANN